MTNGRQKGSRAEREVATTVQAWWRQHEPEAEFVRTPLSGGWGGPSVRAGFAASGDIMTTAKEFPWTLEIKHRESFSLDNLKKQTTKSPVKAWWDQAMTQAQEMSKEPMLWFRQNRQPWRVGMLPSWAPEMGEPAFFFYALDGWKVYVYEASRLLSIHPRVFADAMKSLKAV